MIQKFRKKAVEMEAIQLFTDPNFHCGGLAVLDVIQAVTEMLRDAKTGAYWVGIDPADNKFKISTYDEIIVVNRADWLVKGSNSEIGIVKDEIFKIAFDVSIASD